VSQKRRVEALEASVQDTARVEDLPVLVVTWEDETPEQRRVRRLWSEAGVDLSDAEVRVNWDVEAVK